MTKALGLRGRGRPLGAKNKEKPPAAPLKNSRMLSLMEGCYTAEEWSRRFMKLSPSEQFRLKASVEPKVREEGVATNISLIISGLSAACPHCGGEIPPEGMRLGRADQPRESAGTRELPATLRNRLPGAPAERSVSMPERTRPALVPMEEEAPLPPGTQIFTVPRFEDQPEAEAQHWGGKLDVPGDTEF